jgi:cation:H+ antiporter
VTALLFAGSFLIIVGAAELFTNAIEWAGFRLRLGQGATGSLLAALGTSLPETFVPVVALVTASPGADSVAQGAVLGAPFLLLTVGMSVTGVAVGLRRGARSLRIDGRQARRDLGFFLVAFSGALVAVAAPRALRVLIGIALLAWYAWYVRATLHGSERQSDMPEPLHLVRWRPEQPHGALITLQLAVALALLVVGSELFVHALDDLSAALHFAPLILALVLVPLATELPETMNGVLWVRSRDDTLAFGNIAGSATFQSCVLAFIGLCFTSWRPGAGGVIGGIITLATAAGLLAALRHGRAPAHLLMTAIVPWAGYVVAQVLTAGRLAG